MITLSQQLNNSNLGWDVAKQPNPCLWKGVTCSKSSLITQLSLSGFALSTDKLPVVCAISSLHSLDLSINNLSSISDFIKDCGAIHGLKIGELTNLGVLILSENNLNGGIPTNLFSISTLSRFAANHNNFSGSIPGGLTRYVKNLDLIYNKLTGSILEDLLSFKNLQTVDLSYNLLEGSIPDKMSPSLVRLRLRSNSLNGVIPSANFATLEKLTCLELDNNSFTGMMPPELGDCQTLTLLNLAQNKLNGSLSAQLGNLRSLQVMKLQLNNLSGDIPVQFSLLKNLSQLNISWNSRTGLIPSSFSNLQELTNLSLQHNYLSGSIPDSIRNMNSLTELQLGENQLSGRIPSLPVKLQIALNLISNLFEGSIPHSLSSLTGLEVLGLSNNKLSGKIPVFFFTQMPTLTQLILSNNQSSGIVPKFTLFVSVNISGNPNLIPAPNTFPELAKKKMPVAVSIITAVAAGVLAARVIIFIYLSIPRCFYFFWIILSNFLTENEIHKSNISFTKAMETIANPLNIFLKTKFSTYYKSIMPSGKSYFIKKLNRSDKIFQNDKFEQELEIIGKLNHSNVMTPLAYALTKDSAYLLYEYAQTCTLFDILHGINGSSMDWESRYSVAVGLVQGLAFLNGCTSGPILLLDLSSKNIMLKSLKEPQLGDIELCKVIDPSKRIGSLSTVAGSVDYIPPVPEFAIACVSVLPRKAKDECCATDATKC
ncbi:hypothetical protein Patl1_07838 [Pistacia atlantica]|uniref:Uncharacterized protein n=1 Tax=Pistacia atlantica TaxID=434234 RepID=A0ACC1ALC2_9ROSI|nr:hypothetical protein Patl1_07838 [Pistacia atlantica]